MKFGHIQKHEQVALVFGIVDGIGLDGPVPFGAEYSGLGDGATVCKQETGIGKVAIIGHEAEGTEQALFPHGAGALVVFALQGAESVFLTEIIGHE